METKYYILIGIVIFVLMAITDGIIPAILIVALATCVSLFISSFTR